MEALKSNLSRYRPSFDIALLEKAEKELGETPEKREEACVSLYVRYVSQEGADLGEKYKDQLTDPVYLLRFLRVSKFNVEKALAKLKAWLDHMYGNAWPELAVRLTETERLKQWVFKNKSMLIQNTTKELDGETMKHGAWCSMNKATMDEIKDMPDNMLDVAAVSMIMVDYMYRKDEAAQITGMYTLKDAQSAKSTSNSTWQFLKNPALLGKMIKLWTKTLAVRNRGSLTINQEESFLYKSLMALIRPFMSEKMIQRQKKWGADWKDVEDFPLDLKRIPVSLGGSLSDEEGLGWIDDYYKESVKL